MDEFENNMNKARETLKFHVSQLASNKGVDTTKLTEAYMAYNRTVNDMIDSLRYQRETRADYLMYALNDLADTKRKLHSANQLRA